MPYRRCRRLNFFSWSYCDQIWVVNTQTHKNTHFVSVVSSCPLFSRRLSSPYTPPASLSGQIDFCHGENHSFFFLFTLLSKPHPLINFFSHCVNIHWAMCLEMSSPLRPLGGPYIFHLVWHLFDFVSGGNAMSCHLEKKPWKINHADFLKVSYPISHTCKLETSDQETTFCCWHAGYSFLCLFGCIFFFLLCLCCLWLILSFFLFTSLI